MEEHTHFILHPQNNTVSIYFSQNEYEKLQEAAKYTVLGWNPLLRIFIKNGLDELETSQELTFVFDRNRIVDKKAYKTKVIRLDVTGYEKLAEICACTPFSMSNLVKYLIMPQIDAVIDKKGWNFRP